MPKGHFKGKVWASDKDKVIYFGIPKNASSTIRHMFGQRAKDFLDYGALKDDPKYVDYTRFAILRNPLQRFVSGYVEIIYRAKQHEDTYNRPFYRIKDLITRFRAFVRDIQGDFYDSHIERQWYFVSDTTNNHLNHDIQHFLLFENLAEDIKKLQLSSPLLYVNNHSRPEKALLLNHLKNDHALRGKINTLLLQDWNLYNSIS